MALIPRLRRSSPPWGVLVLIGIAIGLAAYAWMAARPKTFVIAVPRGEPSMTTLMTDFARQASARHAAIPLRVEEVDGEAEGTRRLEAGTAAFLVGRAEKAEAHRFRTAGVLSRRAALLLAPAPRTGGWSDLDGASVLVAAGAGDDETVLRWFAAHHRVEPRIERVANASLADLVARARRERSFVFALADPRTLLRSLPAEEAASTARRLTLAPVALSEALAGRFPQFEAIEVPPGEIYASPNVPDASVATLQVATHLLVGPHVGGDKVIAVARALVVFRQSLIDDRADVAAIQLPKVDRATSPAIHAALADELEGVGKSFLDAYSDLIYVGLALSGVFGSIASLIWSRWFRARLDPGFRHEQRVHALADGLRRARAPRDLDRIDALLDRRISEFAKDVRAGRVSTAGLAAFELACSRARGAVETRRRELDPQAITSSPSAAEGGTERRGVTAPRAA